MQPGHKINRNNGLCLKKVCPRPKHGISYTIMTEAVISVYDFEFNDRFKNCSEYLFLIYIQLQHYLYYWNLNTNFLVTSVRTVFLIDTQVSRGLGGHTFYCGSPDTEIKETFVTCNYKVLLVLQELIVMSETHLATTTVLIFLIELFILWHDVVCLFLRYLWSAFPCRSRSSTRVGTFLSLVGWPLFVYQCLD